MVGMMARGFEEWMKKQERDVSLARRAPLAIVGNAIEIVRGEMAELGTRKPTAPIELTYQTGNYFAGAGYPAVRFIMDFPDVTMATDGQPITVTQYELWGRDVTPGLLDITTSAVPGLAAPGLTAPGLANSLAQQQAEAAQQDTKWLLMATATESGFRVDDFVPMSVWEFKARAISPSSSTPGNFSAVVTVLMEKDSTPPPQPTAPTLKSDRGVLRVEWNGQSVLGAMPADFSYAILAQGDDAEPEREVARFGRVGGFYVATGLEYYDPQFFRVKAFDESGNEGPWSAVATGFTEPMVDKDIILSEIDAAETLIKNIDGGVSIKDGTVVTRNLLVTEDMTAKLAQFLTVKADMIDANELWADEAFFGAADAYLVRSDMFIGKSFEGGVFTTTAGGRFQTNVEDLKGLKIQETGVKAWNSTSGEQTYSLDAATGNVVATGIFQTSATGTRTMLWDHGDGIAAIDMFPSSGDMHGAMFSQPTTGGAHGGWQTNIQHYTDLGAYSAYMILYQDGTWSMGQLDGVTTGPQIFGDGVSGTIFALAKGNGTDKNIILESDKGYVYLHSTGAAATGNIFVTSDNGNVTITGNNGVSLSGGAKSMTIIGRLNVVGGAANGTFYVWKSGNVTSSAQVWNMTYQSPVPNGIRWPFLTVTASDSFASAVDILSTSGFQAVTRTVSGAAALHHIRWFAPWMDQL
jgi:hypothetical protein